MIVPSHTFAVAPMMSYTNRHARLLYRLLSPHTLVYTEMIHVMAALSSKRHRHLAFSYQEQPIAVQLAGNDPRQLAEAAMICEDYGYDEINLNVGCPSNKVRNGNFGACLMFDPEQVAGLVAAITDVVRIPVTIKCRLGVDGQRYEETFPDFVSLTSQAGCSAYCIHARMAWLKGVNPKQNRDLPPLDYEFVYGLKKENPHLDIRINGGIRTIAESLHHLKYTDGVMLGRAILSHPALLQQAEQMIFGGQNKDIINVVRYEYADYAQRQLADNSNVAVLVRPLFSLFSGLPGGGIFRRRLAQRTDLWSNIPKALDYALNAVEDYACIQPGNKSSIVC